MEAANPEIVAFYDRLLLILREVDAFRNGDWVQIEPQSAWSGNGSFDGFVCYAWTGIDKRRFVVVVNYVETGGQCYVQLPFPEFEGAQVRLTDLLGSEIYERDGGELVSRGLYVDLGPWQMNAFELQTMNAADT